MSAESRYEQGLSTYTDWVVRHPWLVTLLGLLSVVALASGARLLTFSTDFRVFFGPDNPQLQAFDQLQNVYGESKTSFVALEAKSGNVFEPRALQALREFTHEAWKVLYVVRVDSITNFPHTEAYGDDLKVEALLPDDAELTPARIAKVREIALHEPVLVHRLVSPRGHVAAVNVATEMPENDLFSLPEHIKGMRELRDRIEAQYPEVEIYFYGVNFASNAQGEASLHDIRTLVPLSVVILAVVTLLLLRSFSAAGATMLIVAVSSATAMGVAGHMGVVLTPPSITAPNIITTLAIADCVHYCVALFGAMRDGRDRRAAAAYALKKNFTPIFLTSITTAVGFMSLNFTDSPPLRELGWITAIGVMLAWLYSMLLLPALMCLLPLAVPANRKSMLENFMAGLAEFILRRRRLVLASVATVSVGLSACILLNETNDLFSEFYDESIEFRRDSDFILKNLSVSYPMEFSLKASGSNGISDPAYLREVEAFATWLRAQPNVAYVGAVTEIFKRLNKSMHGDDPTWYRLPDDAELAAQYLLLYEMSLPFGQDLNNVINIDKSSSRLSVFLGHATTRDIREFAERAEHWLRHNAPAMATHATSMPVMFAYISDRNFKSMFAQIPWALALIILLLIVALRSVKFGLLATVPMVFPTAIAFGIWGLMDGWVNFTMAVVIGAVTGIVDDDAVHLLNEYLRGRRDYRLSPEDAIRHTLRTVGSALTVMTAALVCGILVLTQSAFLPNSGSATLMALAISAALIFDLLLLPCLLLLMDREPAAAPATSPQLPAAGT